MGTISQPTWLIDTEMSCLVFFFHSGPVTNHDHNLGPFPSPNGFWTVGALQVSELNRPLAQGGDAVNVVRGTNLQHIVRPAGAAHATDAAAGVVGNVSGPALNAAAFARGGSVTSSQVTDHPAGHRDQVGVVLTASVRGANITSYRISISGEHVVLPVVQPKCKVAEVRISEHRY